MIGIIGGSGLYQIEGVKITREERLETPFGYPSDSIFVGEMNGKGVAFLPRHGRGHVISPSKINYRANIYAMKMLGVSKIISISAVGSMKESLHPGDVVIIDQLIDRTRGRVNTFFDEGIVVHISFSDPICEEMARILYEAASKVGARVKKGGTYVCIEGPAFSTRAESMLYRSWGVDVIGMTCYQEARLAREAEICYAAAAMITDYDCWHETEEDVNIQSVLTVLKKNTEVAKELVKQAVSMLDDSSMSCSCHSALKDAILTDPAYISEDTRERLSLLLNKYIK